MRRNGDRGKPGGDREILDRSYGFHRTGDRWLPDRWLGMPPFSGSGGPTPPSDSLSDDWGASHAEGTDYYIGGNAPFLGQAIIGKGQKLSRFRFWMKRMGGTITGNIRALLYAGTGTPPKAIFTGPLLAQSDTALDASTVTATPTITMYEFVFTGANQYVLELNKLYVIGVGFLPPVPGLGTALIRGSNSYEPNGHPGNLVWDDGNGVVYDDFEDSIFELYTLPGPPPPVKIDEYPSSNWTSFDNYFDGSITAMAQAFPAKASGNLYSVKFWLKKMGAPPAGSLTAKLYAATGTMGSTAVPTGSPLAVSNPVPVSAISATPGFVEFKFSGQYALLNGTNYAMALEQTGLNASNYQNCIPMGIDDDGVQPNHPGNWSYKFSTSFNPDVNCDAIFELYTGPSAGLLSVADSYAPSNMAVNGYPLRGGRQKISQIFDGNGQKAFGVRFVLSQGSKLAVAQGNIIARLYDSDGSIPVGEPLASSPPMDAAEVTNTDLTAEVFYDFLFSEQADLQEGVKYAVSIEREENTLAWDATTGFITPGADDTGIHGGKYGNMAFTPPETTGPWSTVPGYDMVFAVVTSGVAEVPEPPAGPPLIDSWPIEHQTTTYAWAITANEDAIGQTLVNLAAGKLFSAKFSLQITGILDGNLFAELHLSGPLYPATGNVPVAISDPIPVTDVANDAMAMYEFLFHGEDLVPDNKYAICLVLRDNTILLDGANFVRVGQAQGAATGHPGDTLRRNRASGVWANNPFIDTIFYLYATEVTYPPLVYEDYNPYYNMNDGGSYGFFHFEIWAICQSFTALKGEILSKVKVYARRNAGNVDHQPLTCRIYESTTTVDDAIPEGAAIASSDPVDSALFVTANSPEPVEFLFTGANQIQFVKDKVYCLSIERPNTQSMDVMRFGFWNHALQPGHPGIYSQCKATWEKNYAAGFDMIFYVINP